MPWGMESCGLSGIALLPSYCLQQTGLCGCVQQLAWGYGLWVSFGIWSDWWGESPLLLFWACFPANANKFWGTDLAWVSDRVTGIDDWQWKKPAWLILWTRLEPKTCALASGVQLSPSSLLTKPVWRGDWQPCLLSGSGLWLWCLGFECPCCGVVELCLLTPS